MKNNANNWEKFKSMENNRKSRETRGKALKTKETNRNHRFPMISFENLIKIIDFL